MIIYTEHIHNYITQIYTSYVMLSGISWNNLYHKSLIVCHYLNINVEEEFGSDMAQTELEIH